MAVAMILTATAQLQARDFTVDLWPDGLPNSNGIEQQGYDDSKQNYRPSIRVYLPDNATRPTNAVLLCPGGGYHHLALNHEGNDWGPYLNAQGVAVVVLKYRMPHGHYEVPESDAVQALKILHDKAKEWNINPDNIGIMGGSAGGHLASTVATGAPKQLRPAFQILLYPIISMQKGLDHQGSRTNLLGNNPGERLAERYSSNLRVDNLTPDALILVSKDDTDINHKAIALYADALRKHGKRCRIVEYPTGKHGWGIKTNFEYHAEALLEIKNYLKIK